MAELDNWTDDRLAATRALAERIQADLAVLVAGLRPEPTKPAANDGTPLGQWRLTSSGEQPYLVEHGLSVHTWNATLRGREHEIHVWPTSRVAADPIIPAPPDKSAVWAKPRKGQRLWDAYSGEWIFARRDFEDGIDTSLPAEVDGYPREAGPWRWCEPVAEQQPKFPTPTWAMHYHTKMRYIVCSGDTGLVTVRNNQLRSLDEYTGTPESEWTACEDPRVAWRRRRSHEAKP